MTSGGDLGLQRWVSRRQRDDQPGEMRDARHAEAINQLRDRICKPICKRDAARQARTRGMRASSGDRPATLPPRSASTPESDCDARDGCLMPHNPEVVGSNPAPLPRLEAGSEKRHLPHHLPDRWQEPGGDGGGRRSPPRRLPIV